MAKSTAEAVTNYPAKSPVVRRQLAKDDVCPECDGELDTGWECNSCGFDAKPLRD